MTHRCFACDRKLGKNPNLVDTRDDQTVFVGAECYKLVKAGGEAGWQPPKGGPRLYLIPKGLDQQSLANRHAKTRGFSLNPVAAYHGDKRPA